MATPAIKRPLLLGITAGMRSQLPLALLALASRRGLLNVGPEPPWTWLRLPKVGIATGLLAAGEIMNDKLPITPSRLEPAPLGGRLTFGALAGAACSPAERGSRLQGALLGAAGAGMGAYGGYRLRAALGKDTGLPDPVWGAVEDGVALGIGFLALQR